MSSFSLVRASLGFLVVGSVIASMVQPAAIAVPTLPSQPQKVVAEPIKDPFLLKIRKIGGRCSPNHCKSELVILENGTYRYEDGDKATQGRFDRRSFAQFKGRLARVNLQQIKSKPATTCPTMYDAPETVYLFRVGRHVEQISECKYQIDPQDRLFQQANQFYEKAVEQAYAVDNLRK